MAIPKEKPNVVFSRVVRKVAIPSGILCKIMASMEIIPTLYKELLLKSGSLLSKNIETTTPKEKEISVRRIEGTK